MSRLPKKTVVVPVDFSTASADAIKTAHSRRRSRLDHRGLRGRGSV